MKSINLVGQIFDRLTIINLSHTDKSGHKRWKCKCLCGNIVYVSTSALNSGHVKSCGCKNKEWLHRSKTSHGMTNSRFYKIWKGIVYRCTKPKCNTYKNYGNRGIKIDNKWLKFENFRDDMHESYLEHVNKFGEKQTSIDRIDNNGNYCKENCRWATWEKQGNNRKSNVIIEYNGEENTIRGWEKKLKMKKNTLNSRLEDNWPINIALTKSVRYRKRY